MLVLIFSLQKEGIRGASALLNLVPRLSRFLGVTAVHTHPHWHSHWVIHYYVA